MIAQPRAYGRSRGGAAGPQSVLRILCAAIFTIALVPLPTVTSAAARGDMFGHIRARNGEMAMETGGHSALDAATGRRLLHNGCHAPSCAPDKPENLPTGWSACMQLTCARGRELVLNI